MSAMLTTIKIIGIITSLCSEELQKTSAHLIVNSEAAEDELNADHSHIIMTSLCLKEHHKTSAHLTVNSEAAEDELNADDSHIMITSL
jgi:hypothetical protein